MTEAKLTTRQLNRALIERQLLVERSPLSTEEAVEHLVGLQAQAVNPPYIGLWTRLRDFSMDDLESALEERRLIRIALMRSTIHLVSPRDGLGLRSLLAESLARIVKGQFGKLVGGLEPAEIAEYATKLAENGPLTFAELGKLMTERWPDRDANALAQTARNLVPLVQIPPRGLWNNTGAARHTPMAQWLAKASVGPVPDLEDYVVRYLGAFGPAGVMDMQKWSGMTRLKQAFVKLGGRLRTYRSPDGTLLYDLADAAVPAGDTDVPARYLPEFDNILISHADRTHVISDEHRAAVFTNNGIIRSTILVDGFVRGRWHVDRTKDGAELVIEPFTRLPKNARAELHEEGEALLSFLAPEHEQHRIRFDS